MNATPTALLLLRPIPIPWYLGLIGLITFACESGPTRVSFNEDIRPIINTRCAGCHGGVKRNGGLSLLYREAALTPAESGRPAIVPGQPDSSELLRRLVHTDPEMRMPQEGEALSEAQVALFRRWIAEGADWETHWAYRLPDSTLVPPSTGADWGQNGLDAFVYRRLKAEGLDPSPPADRATLLRRVSLDLIGLPPHPDSVLQFEQDEAPDAFEKRVDQLLASPLFGEHWAAMWLDLARYGDSQGYQKDRYRNIWRYRDWVIRAFNADMPLDQFTQEQLAGDLLPNPDDNQLIATAFHRNTMTNDEGGTDDEEFRVVAVIDRVNTTFEVWQGLTIACVQCHSHPYDPFPHQEFYQLYAFFNNTADADRTDEFPLHFQLTPADSQEIQALRLWLAENSSQSPDYRTQRRRLGEIYTQASTPILQELPPDSSRSTYVFERGNWLVHGAAVAPAVPAILGKLQTSGTPTRLDLASWLFSTNNPLTARVMVNRFWAQMFGQGIVRTLEDFGSQGDRPSHPALLDWLATQFRQQHRWRLKALLRQLVLSSTYQQSSGVSPALLARDPYNRLLARGPRVRLSAEQIRDQALAVSGLLSPRQYGPSVMPPQPEGVWQVIRNVMRWQPSPGEDRYRRSLYTFWRKSSPYPAYINFDSPSRELCLSRRIRTNTPLQALTTLNDSTYQEASRALAAWMMQADTIADQQIRQGYRRAMLKAPQAHTLQRLMAFYDKSLDYFQARPDSIAAFWGTDTLPQAAQQAALAQVATVLLNLDEFITKE